jgi:hypothetical protein
VNPVTFSHSISWSYMSIGLSSFTYAWVFQLISSFGITRQTFCMYFLSTPLHIHTYTSHPPWFGHPNNICILLYGNVS